MKSSTMLAVLRDAEWENRPVKEAELAYYLAQGSFRVREEIGDLIRRHSIVVGELSIASRLRLLGEQMRAVYGRVEPFEFTEYIRCFLQELGNFKVAGIARQERLQELLAFIEGIVGELPPEEARYQEAVWIDPIVIGFPEIANNKVYRYGARLAAMIAGSYAIYGDGKKPESRTHLRGVFHESSRILQRGRPCLRLWLPHTNPKKGLSPCPSLP